MTFSQEKKIYLVITPFFPCNHNFQGSYIYDQIVALSKLSAFEIVVIKIKIGFGNYSYQFGQFKVNVI